MINYDQFLNQELANVKPSGIRRFFDIASEIDDVISLSIGEPDFSTPWHIREAGIDSLEKGKTWYSPNRGFADLREEISRWFNRKYGVTYAPDTDILVSVGGSEAIDLALRSLLNPGDEVLIPVPSFVCYTPLTEVAKGVAVQVETKAENNFRLTVADIEAHITPRTKILVLPFPNNPTGAVMRHEHLEEIATVIQKHNLFVISDELYSELTYGSEPHVTIASIPGMKERSIVINGFSKAFAMTGWRLGIAVGPKEVIAQMTKLHQYGIMSAPSIAQYAAIEALKNGDKDIEYMRDQYDIRRRLLVNTFNELGLTCFEPEGAFYVFPDIRSTGLDSETFCEKLLYAKHVAIVPGNAFGDCGEGFVRVAYANSLANIKEALKRIKEFLVEIKQA
ncbi:aminotransferase class I/II-fold pyridoxal phosphate-dependent enzyme [Veillonella sp. R32]|uniref:aminotransferase class I/II-fold pyridoxal phosphate-dependent enzyme n=1 Tax=Veillonella sp. R32 TaxID=2021312 RepID=UPI00138966A3|nr:aminotransferase class I/II-fold pyridoxal phosphate-dependent enzyme [Veillonella sp. R32]KAF1683785.1 aromatic amino acid aminotransferase [Veillonella sp. R32]